MKDRAEKYLHEAAGTLEKVRTEFSCKFHERFLFETGVLVEPPPYYRPKEV
jgi:hypothetical protein